jgi:hypothetical protein
MSNLERLIKNSFKTLTGGILYYDHQNLSKGNEINKNIKYYSTISLVKKYKPIIYYRTIIWLGEEIHKVNCEQNIYLLNMVILYQKGLNLFQVFFQKHLELFF